MNRLAFVLGCCGAVGDHEVVAWDTSEPDLSALECTVLNGSTLKLADEGCTSGRRMVCECDGNPVDPTTY